MIIHLQCDALYTRWSYFGLTSASRKCATITKECGGDTLLVMMWFVSNVFNRLSIGQHVNTHPHLPLPLMSCRHWAILRTSMWKRASRWAANFNSFDWLVLNAVAFKIVHAFLVASLYLIFSKSGSKTSLRLMLIMRHTCFNETYITDPFTVCLGIYTKSWCSMMPQFQVASRLFL